MRPLPAGAIRPVRESSFGQFSDGVIIGAAPNPTGVAQEDTLPHVRAWAARYKEYGLVVLGVHTPEFSFEEDIDNVRRSVRAMGIEYPIAVDSDRAIWQQSGALCVAWWRVEEHASDLSAPSGSAAESVGPQLRVDGQGRSRRPEVAGGRIAYRFHARDLHLILGPAARGTSVRFRVFIDGQPAGVARGTDVDDRGDGTVAEQRLYQLVRQPGPVHERVFEIEFLNPGVEAFAFTFG